VNAFAAYSIVALVSALASLLIGFGVTNTLTRITDSGMWAIAAMVFAPAFMGIGVSLFICMSHRAHPPHERERRLPPEDPYDAGAFTSKDR
jgi:hypothetical protein